MNTTIPEDSPGLLISEYLTTYPREAAQEMTSFPPEKVVEYMRTIPVESARELFRGLDSNLSVSVVEALDDIYFAELIGGLDLWTAARILSRLDSDSQKIKLGLLPKNIQRELKELLSYPHDSAGYLMDTQIVTFRPEMTSQEVLNIIRKLGDKRIFNIYITNSDAELIGYVPIHILALARDDQKIEEILQEANFSVPALTTQSDVVKLLDQKKLVSVPVVNIENKILGIIRYDALVKAAAQEAIEDVQTIFGAGKDERALSPALFAIKKRLPWLEINLATAFLAASVVGAFEDTIAKITVLAVFLPVVAGQSGNTGSQALAVTIRGLALREFQSSQWLRVAKKEMIVGFVNGVAVALTTSIIVFFWTSSVGLGVVIAVSMVVSMVIAGFSGAVIPIILKGLGQDPAQSSSIILTTVTDVVGFLSFLGLATILSSALGIV